jgi:hypothetical protein
LRKGKEGEAEEGFVKSFWGIKVDLGERFGKIAGSFNQLVPLSNLLFLSLFFSFSNELEKAIHRGIDPLSPFMVVNAPSQLLD